MNTYIKLVCALIVGAQITLVDAMESSEVIIVDSNKNQELLSSVPEGHQVCIFGATPRYAFFRKCMSILQHHLEELDAAYNKSKRLKGVPKTIKQVMATFKQVHPDKSIAEHFNLVSQDAQLKLFFKIGFNRSILKKNMEALCECVQQVGSREVPRVLLHILLPIYFDDCASYQPSVETVHAFLTASAQFYKNAYEQCEEMPDVRIYVPSLEYFKEVLAVVDDMSAQDKDVHVARLLKAELFDKLSHEKPSILINPSARQLEAFAALSSQEGIEAHRMKLVELILMLKLKRTKSFTPYVLQFKDQDETHCQSFIQSSLITQDLTDLLPGETDDESL